MAQTPVFVITDVGLAAAQQAGANIGNGHAPGPYVEIVEWRVGTAYGYTPQRTDTGLNGAELASGQPLTYTYVGDNTLNIICRINADEGPFDFGEVALYMADGTMFCKAAFDAPQTKYSSLGSNVGSTYTFNCLLKLEQSVAVFKIDTAGGIPPDVYTVEKWSDVFPPSLMAEPSIPLIRVLEPNPYGNTSLLVQDNTDSWSVVCGYRLYDPQRTPGPGSGRWTVANSSTNWIEIPASQLYPVLLTPGWGGVNRQFLIKTPDSFFRSVSSIQANGANYRFNLNPDPLQAAPAVGTTVSLMVNDTIQYINYDQIVDPPSIPLATQSVPGLAQPRTGTQMPTAGIFDVVGLNIGLNSGRSVTPAEHLDWFTTNGVYFFSANNPGAPAYPSNAYSAIVYVSSYAVGLTVQVYWPLGGGDGAPGPSWRTQIGSAWTPWSQLLSTNKGGSGGSVQTVGASFTALGDGVVTVTNPGIYGDTQSVLRAYVNGNEVAYSYQANGKYGNRGDAVSFGCYKGSFVEVTTNNGFGSPIRVVYFNS